MTQGAGRDAPSVLEWLSAAQKDLCVYCGCETWLPSQRRQEARFRVKWDLPAARSLADQLAFDCRMASIEHLSRRAEGGGDRPGNLAMARTSCNTSRGDRSPEAHARAMRRLKRGGQHPCFPKARGSLET